MILAVEDDGFEDIVNYDTVDELDLDDYDDVKKMLDKDDNIENSYTKLESVVEAEKLEPLTVGYYQDVFTKCI